VDQALDIIYGADLQVGTPPKPYTFLLCTGLSDTYLAEIGAVGYYGNSAYDPSQSSTANVTNTTFSIDFTKGNVTGVVATDTMSLGTYTHSGQVFGLVQRTIDNVFTGGAPGVLGLNLYNFKNGTPKFLSFLERLVASNELPEPLMAFYFARHNNESGVTSTTQSLGGEFHLGYVDSSFYTGPIDYVATTEKYPGQWVIPIRDATIGGKTLSLGSQTALISSGTTLIYGPMDIVTQVYALIPGAVAGAGADLGIWIIPCDTSVEFSLGFGKSTWKVSAGDFVRGASSRKCFGALAGMTTEEPRWQIGVSFMKNVYSVFRLDPQAVGFASLAANILPPPTASASITTQLSHPVPSNGVNPNIGGENEPGGGGGGGGFSSAPNPTPVAASAAWKVEVVRGIVGVMAVVSGVVLFL
jgi:cathepsin D